jgi:CRP/FNR family transcriptional regulator
MVWTRQELHRALGRDPSLAGWFAEALSGRIGRLQAWRHAAMSMGVRGRTLFVLRQLADRWGREHSLGTAVDLPLTQESLACLVGATRESVNRGMHDLRAGGLVFKAGRRYVIPGG